MDLQGQVLNIEDECGVSYNARKYEISQKPTMKGICHMSQLKVLVTQSCPTFCDPTPTPPAQAPLSMEFSRQEYWSG